MAARNFLRLVGGPTDRKKFAGKGLFRHQGALTIDVISNHVAGASPPSIGERPPMTATAACALIGTRPVLCREPALVRIRAAPWSRRLGPRLFIWHIETWHIGTRAPAYYFRHRAPHYRNISTRARLCPPIPALATQNVNFSQYCGGTPASPGTVGTASTIDIRTVAPMSRAPRSRQPRRRTVAPTAATTRTGSPIG